MRCPSRSKAQSISFICALALGCSASADQSPDFVADGSGGAAQTGGAGGSAGKGGGTTPGGASGNAAGGARSVGSGGARSVGSGGASLAGGGSASGGTNATGGSSVEGGAPVVGPCDALPPKGQWQEITPAGGAIPRAIALDPFNTATVWLGTAPGSAGGLYKSLDCGATWSHVSTGANGAKVDTGRIWSMVVDPVAEGVIYVIGYYGALGLFKSTNGGVDWTQLAPAGSELASAVPVGSSSPAGIGSVAMDPFDHLHLVVGTHNDCTGPYAPACMAESTDGGATWTIFKTPFLKGWAEQTGPYLLDQNTIVYQTLGDGIWLTTNHGTSWTNVTPAGVSGATGGEYANRPFSPSKDGTYYLPSYNQGGLLRSKDVGRTWSRIANAPTGSYEVGFAMGGGNLYLGDNFDKTYAVASEADPTTWTKLAAPALVEGAKSMEYDETHHLLYSSNVTGGLWRIVTP